MIRVLPCPDRDLVKNILLRAIAGPYPLERVVDEKLGPGYRGDPSFTIALQGERFVGATVTCGEYLRLIGVEPETRGQGAGTALLADAEKRISARFERIVVAAEPGNYFTPGVLPAAAPLFTSRGYAATAEAVNLDAATVANGSDKVRRAEGRDRDRVLDFIDSTFGRIWRFEASSVFERAIPTMVIAESDDSIIGFSAWCANNAALGTYGPAGVAPAHRRTGIGRALLLGSLAEMRRDGWDRALIQWAAAIDYYRRVAGARVAEQFLVLEKRFGA